MSARIDENLTPTLAATKRRRHATLRVRIWRRLLPNTAPTDGTVDVAALSRRYRLSGGQIKNVVFRAAFRTASAEELQSGIGPGGKPIGF